MSFTVQATCRNDDCEADIPVEVDGDGDFVAPSFNDPGDAPTFYWITPESCPECERVFDAEELKALDRDVSNQVDAYDFTPDPPCRCQDDCRC